MYETIYNIYDEINTTKPYQLETEFIIKKYTEIIKQCPNSVLDIGCGTGKHLECFSSLVNYGLGIDICNKMIQKAKELKLNNIDFVSTSVQEITNEHKYDLVTMLFNVVNHISSLEELDLIIDSINKKTTDNAVLIFDMFNIIAMIKDPPVSENRNVGNKEIHIKPEFDMMNSKLTLYYEINGQEYTLSETMWSPLVLKQLLHKYGFRVSEILSSWTDKDANTNDYKLLFICQKIQ